MSRFIAVHTMSLTEEQHMAAISTLPLTFPAGVAWKLTYCDFADGKFFCEWEGPSKQAIEQVLEAEQTPFDAVYPVRTLDVATGKLEP